MRIPSKVLCFLSGLNLTAGIAMLVEGNIPIALLNFFASIFSGIVGWTQKD